MAKSLIKSQMRINRDLEQENAQLRAALAKAKADLEYVAMMADIDIEEEFEDE